MENRKPTTICIQFEDLASMTIAGIRGRSIEGPIEEKKSRLRVTPIVRTELKVVEYRKPQPISLHLENSSGSNTSARLLSQVCRAIEVSRSIEDERSSGIPPIQEVYMFSEVMNVKKTGAIFAHRENRVASHSIQFTRTVRHHSRHGSVIGREQ